MAYQAPIETLEMRGWAGGLNREADQFQLEMNETPDCLNVDFGDRGAVSKRKGYTKFSTSDPVGMTVGQHLFVWRFLGGAEWLVYVASDGKVYVTSGTTFAAPSTAPDFGSYTTPSDYDFSLVAMNNNLYLSTLRGSDAPQKFDGTTWTDLAVANFDGTIGAFPRARTLLVAHERIFAANVRTAGGTSYRSRIYWSEPATPGTWTALGYIDVAPDDGQEITGTLLFGEQIVIWKNNSMFLLSGTDENTFSLYPLDSALGTESPRTAVAYGASVMFFSHLSGVWAFDGSGFKQLDKKISTYLLDGVNKSAPEVAYGFIWRNRYYLCVPWGASTVPNRTFAYDPKLEAWTEYDFAVSAFAVQEGVPLAVGNRGSVGVFRLFDSTSDNGQAVSAFFRTAWLAPESASAKHRVRRMDMALAAKGDVNVTVDMRRDFTSDAYRSQTVNTSPGGFIWNTTTWGGDTWGSGVVEVLKRLTGWGDTWRVSQFTFREATVAGDFQVNRLVLQVSSRRRVRGEH